ncbi:uncharacterized protein [Montipora foliosa]|uniref:uncharacterized protein n=1 Tax=Montipora foliosa TaxID=591990 RepID=UPI0035F1CA55
MKNIICLVAVFGIACLGVFSHGGQNKTINSQSSNGGAGNKVSSTTVPKSDGYAKETGRRQNETINSQINKGGTGNKVSSTTVPKSDGYAKETVAHKEQMSLSVMPPRKRLGSEPAVPNSGKTLEGMKTVKKMTNDAVQETGTKRQQNKDGVQETDIRRKQNAMRNLSLCEIRVAAASLNESMPCDNQTSEFATVEGYVKNTSKLRGAWMAMK